MARGGGFEAPTVPLWKRKTKNGKVFFSGSQGDLNFLIFQVERKSDKSPHLRLVIADNSEYNRDRDSRRGGRRRRDDDDDDRRERRRSRDRDDDDEGDGGAEHTSDMFGDDDGPDAKFAGEDDDGEDFGS